MRHPHSSHQQGFSLIELMIAVTLSLILLGAVVQVFLSSRQTYELSDDLSRIQENGRFSLDFLAQNIRMAGYTPGGADNPLSFYEGACGGFNPCTSDGGANNNDRIAVRLNPPPDDGTETDCTGAAVGANDEIANVYYITTEAGTGINRLTCRGFNITNDAWIAVEQPLIDGIDGLQFLYGIDSSGTGVTQYISSNSLTATTWGQIEAVRIGLLIGSGSEKGSAEKIKREFALLDSTLISFDDEHIRQIYTSTVSLNN